MSLAAPPNPEVSVFSASFPQRFPNSIYEKASRSMPNFDSALEASRLRVTAVTRLGNATIDGSDHR